VTLICPQSAAAQLYNQWKSLALSSDQHLLAVYGQTSTWTLGYNLFADAWLGTNLVDPSVGVSAYWSHVVSDKFQIYNSHSKFLDNLTLTSTFSAFGMPVDNLLSDTDVVVSSWYFYYVYILMVDVLLGWNLFVAAMTQDGELCSHLISSVHNRASFNTTSEVFPLNYDSSHGSTIQGAAR